MNLLNLGIVDYKTAWDFQKKTVQQRLAGDLKDTLIICTHPPVATLGKNAPVSDLFGWEGPFYHIERGGRATYHGPEQVIIYPIIHLKEKGQNIGGLLKAMETAIIKTLSHYQIEGHSRPGRNPPLTGVWCGNKKIASLGIALRRWVTYHGLALNLYQNKDAFRGVRPCGMSPEKMISLEELKDGQKVSRQELERYLTQYLVQGIEALSFFPNGL